MASFGSSAQEIVGYEHQWERSIASPKLYDVFISHRGPDVKDTFAKQLYDLLKSRECRAFLDREEIEGGDSIPFAIRNGICSSRVQIAIFSEGYAQSSWCLDELLLMLEQTDALFIPIFYDVQPWELRHIQNEKSTYAKAFSYYQSKGRNLDKLDEWKKALTSAADIYGYERSQHQDNLCEKIVSRVLQVLQEKEKWIPLHVAEYPVGLAELVQDFESSCSETVNDKAKIVGIFGLGGSGKTTLAKELLNIKRSGYSATCFLSDVRESQAKGELHCLQSQLFKDLFDEDQKFMNIDGGLGKLKDRLKRASNLRFLIVLDDIDHRDQLGALLVEGMLSPGSLVIVTTRDQSVLRSADITISYRMKGMNKDHAKELFCSHAFRGQDPPTAYEKWIESFVEFCGGLPLSLKVLGAHVYRRDEFYWELELQKVKNIQPKDIMRRLKISFDGLDREEKHIFTDIACFFNMKLEKNIKSTAISIWNASGWNAEHAVQTLQDKCLVEVRGSHGFGHFKMHDHLRDLGRQIANDLGPPRLWNPHRLRSMETKGFKQILTGTKARCFHSFRDSSLNAAITFFVGGLNDSGENELLWLDIDNKGCNIKNLPSWIPLQKLHSLTVSNMEEWWSSFEQQLQNDVQACFELRTLKILNSPLQNFPYLMGKFNYLEELEIARSLKKTDQAPLVQSVKHLSNLRLLKLHGNGVPLSGELNLSKGRDSINFEASTSSRMNRLETIVFDNFDNISKLIITGEMCPRLQSLEVQSMYTLTEMHLKQLERLNTLVVWGCPNLETLSGLSSLNGLQVLLIENCEGLKYLPNFAHLRRLERIKVSECHQLHSIQGLEQLQGLKGLIIEVPNNRDASVRNCIYGLRRLPSEYIILTQNKRDTAWSRLNVNLFSEVIRAEAVTEIQRGWTSSLEMNNLAVLLTANNCNATLDGVTIHRGFKATVKKGEEGKALTVLQRIVNRFYGQSIDECD
ncbi:hypothetical protein SUGI_0666940 [Cryptomeria japonica]|nr:hypothetical protein SUGI_0666940 [Cryptomeria japonica]